MIFIGKSKPEKACVPIVTTPESKSKRNLSKIKTVKMDLHTDNFQGTIANIQLFLVLDLKFEKNKSEKPKIVRNKMSKLIVNNFSIFE